jgi:hypothetical protein
VSTLLSTVGCRFSSAEVSDLRLLIRPAEECRRLYLMRLKLDVQAGPTSLRWAPPRLWPTSRPWSPLARVSCDGASFHVVHQARV